MALTRPRAAQIYDIDYKQATRVVTVSNITLSGGAPNQVDGVNLSIKDRVLVTGQGTSSENGIYYVTTLGTGSNGTWTRSADTDATGELLSGTIVMVTEGLVYADTQWKLTTNDPITIGVTGLTFVQNYSANSISGGNSNVVVYNNSSVAISSAGSANVLTVDSGVVTVTANIVPSSNVTYSLGNNTNRFSNLWLSNTTIYLGNVIVGATATDLTVNGACVVVASANTDIQTAGNISATGNIDGNYLNANIYYATGFSASRIYLGNSEVNVTSSGGNVNVSVGGTSNVAVFAAGGEYITGLQSVSGNITGANLLTSGIVSATGNATVGNLNTGGMISAIGNVDANYLNANIYYATGFSASKIFSGNSEVNVTSSGGNVNVSIGGTSNVVVWSTDGEYITGLQSVSGNVQAGNLRTAGLISATGNINGNYINANGSALTGVYAFSNIGVTGQNTLTANSIASTLTFTAGNNIILTGNTITNSIVIDYSSSGGSSIFATGGDMGLVTEVVTSSEDLGNVVDVATTSYDLGQLGVQGVVSNDDIINYQITGNKFANNITISTTGNITGAKIAFTSSIDDVRGWWFGSGNAFSVNSQETAPTDVIFNTSGTAGFNMYVVGTSSNLINQYILSTPWQANTASYWASANVAAQDTSPQGIRFNDTNTVIYMLGGTNKTVYQYNVTYSNVATLSYASKSFSVNSQETAPKGMTFSDDLSKMYIVGTTSSSIFQYTLSTPGDVSTASYSAPGSFSVSSQDPTPTGIEFTSDGKTCFVVGSATAYIYQYTLATAWDVTTASYTGYKFSIFAQEGAATGLYRNAASQFAYITGAHTGTARVWQYNIGNGTVASSNSAYFTGQIQTVGNIQTQGYLFGNGALLSGVTAATIANTTSNVTAGTAGGNITVGIGGTPNVAIFTTTGISATGNVNANYFVGNGAALTGITSTPPPLNINLQQNYGGF